MAFLEKAAAALGRNEVIYFGGRKSDKFVRGYEKHELDVYRVELELHSGFLRGHQIRTLEGLEALASAIYPRHIRFVAVDWIKLERYLTRAKNTGGHAILAGAKERAASVHRVCRYLRRHGVNNPHRFLMPMRLNRKLMTALRRWERKFKREGRWKRNN